jgi:uncharacterized protein YegJ (DUF2314 family)
MAIQWWIAAALIAILIIRRVLRRRKPADLPPAAIVVLRCAPRPMNAQFLADLMGRVTERSVCGIGPDDATDPNDQRPIGDMVAGASPHFVARIDGTDFLIHNVSRPYMNDPARACKSIREMRTQKAVAEHTAWLSVEVLHPQAVTEDNYRIVGRAVAELIDQDSLALYHPPLNRFASWTMEECVEKLRTDDPIREVFQETGLIPVIPVASDPRLAAAEEEARRRFPEFEAAFRQNDGSNFSIKAKITVEDRSEHIWIQVDTITDGHVTGALGNEPVNLPGLKMGSKVDVEIGQVEDWAFTRGKELTGGFTVKILMQISEENARKN